MTASGDGLTQRIIHIISDKSLLRNIYFLKNIKSFQKAFFHLFINVISSNINEVMSLLVLLFIFFYKKVSHAPKAQKVQKAQKRK